MTTGKVLWFDTNKGFGFIAADDGREVYVNYKDVENFGVDLRQTVEVEFEISASANGLRAQNVVIKGKPSSRVKIKEVGRAGISVEKGKQQSGNAGRRPVKKEGDNSKGRPLSRGVTEDADYYFSQALLAKQSKDRDKARGLFEKAIELGANIHAFYSYAAMEKELRHYDRARRIFQRGLAKFPNDGKLYEDYGVLERQRGQAERAAEIFRQGLEHAPSHRMLHKCLAEALFMLGSPEHLAEAEEHFSIAKKVGASNQVSDHQHKLVKVLRGHPRGSMSLKFLEQAGFSPTRIILHQNPSYAVDFIVKPMRTEYVESYDLSGGIFARCLYKNNATVEDMNQVLHDIRECEFPEVNRDVLFLILQSGSYLRDHLWSLLERAGKNPTIVPIEESQIRAGLDTSDSEGHLKQILEEWLYRRNLYEENFPVSGRRFFGREHELAGLIRSIDSGNPVGLFGLRKVGKTSLLKKLKEKRPQDIVIYIDLQKVPGGLKDCAYLYYEMANQLRTDLREKYPQIEKIVHFTLGGRHKGFDAIPKKEMLASQFDDDLRELNEAIRARTDLHQVKVLVLLDEVERVLPVAQSEGFKGYSDLFAYLRGISQQDGFLISIITGANPAICDEPQWEGRDNPVFKFYKETFLPPLEKHECYEMVRKLGRGMGISFTEGGLQQIYKETGGHPFVTRQLCSRIARHFETRPLLVNEEKVRRGTQEFLFNDADIFRDILARLERDFPEEKDLLLLIAEGINSQAELVRPRKSGAHEGLRHLVGYQLVERDETTYRIKMELLLKWIRHYWLNLEE